MKKIIFKFWLVNLLISIALYFFYRILIIETMPMDTTWLGKILSIMDMLANLSFAMIYLAVMVLGSLLYFLNLIERIKNNYFLSLLTFSGLPFVCIVFLGVNVSMDFYQYGAIPSPLKTLLFFSILYLLCTIMEFLMFRRKMKKAVVRMGNTRAIH